MKQFEIRYRLFKRGLRSEQTVKIEARTREGAKRKFLQGLSDEGGIHIISIFARAGDSLAKAQ